MHHLCNVEERAIAGDSCSTDSTFLRYIYTAAAAVATAYYPL